MAKTLCKSKQARKSCQDALTKQPMTRVRACRKCGRLSKSKRRLCKPSKPMLACEALTVCD